MEKILILQRDRTRTLYWLICIALLFIWLFSFSNAYASYGIGDFISEKLIDNSGANNSQLLVERDGVANSDANLTMGVIVELLPPTNVTTTQATLQAGITDMKNFPTANVYFEWGYTAAYGNTTPVQTMTGLGNFGATITGLSGGQTVHFRGVSEADGTYQTGDSTFYVASTGSVVAHEFLWLIIPLIILTAMIILAIKFKSFTLVIIGIAAYAFSWILAKALLGVAWPWSW